MQGEEIAVVVVAFSFLCIVIFIVSWRKVKTIFLTFTDFSI